MPAHHAAPLDDAPRAPGHGDGAGDAAPVLTFDDVAAAVADGIRRAGLAAPDRLLTLDDVAAHLAVSRSTAERLVREGEIVPLWIAGARRFTPAALNAFVRACPAGNVRHRKHAAHRRAKPRAR